MQHHELKNYLKFTMNKKPLAARRFSQPGFGRSGGVGDEIIKSGYVKNNQTFIIKTCIKQKTVCSCECT